MWRWEHHNKETFALHVALDSSFPSPIYTINLSSSYIDSTQTERHHIEEMEIKERRETLLSEGGRKNITLVEGSWSSPTRPSDVRRTKVKTLDYLL